MESSLTRRGTLAAIAGVGTSSLAGCSDAFASDSASSWPSFRYDAANSGTNPHATGPGEGMALSWNYEFPFGVTTNDDTDRPPTYVSSPVVLGDRVFVAADVAVGTDLSTNVVALERTGAEDWHRSFGYAPEDDTRFRPVPCQTLTSDGDTLFLVTEDGSVTLRALDPKTGEDLWTQSLESPLSSPPTAAFDHLYAGEATYAVFDTADGTLERRYEWVEDEEDDEEDVQRWMNDPQVPPTVTDDVVYAGVGDTLRATDRSDGSFLWEADSPFESVAYDGGTRFFQPVVTDDVVYAATGDIDTNDLGGLLALSADDGELLWDTQPNRTERDAEEELTGDAHAGLFGLPVVLEEENTICAFGSERGERGLFGLDLEDGSIRWHRTDVGALAPVVGDGVVYAASWGTVAAIDPTDGEVLTSVPFESQMEILWESPAVVDEHLYVTSAGGVTVFEP